MWKHSFRGVMLWWESSIRWCLCAVCCCLCAHHSTKHSHLKKICSGNLPSALHPVRNTTVTSAQFNLWWCGSNSHVHMCNQSSWLAGCPGVCLSVWTARLQSGLQHCHWITVMQGWSSGAGCGTGVQICHIWTGSDCILTLHCLNLALGKILRLHTFSTYSHKIQSKKCLASKRPEPGLKNKKVSVFTIVTANMKQG